MMGLQTIIELRDIRKTYRLGKRIIEVLHGIDLSVSKGEMLAIMGASGSGKSTLLNILGCMDRPDHGSYTLFGKSMLDKSHAELSRYRNEHFGYIIQDYALIRDLNVIENIRIPLDYSRKMIPKDRVITLMKELEIDGLEKSRASLLSGGEQQRVAIARALVNDPDIILADEPTGALDSSIGKQVMEILKRIADSGKTVIIVTHDKNVASFCDRTLFISDGRIVQSTV